MIALMKLSTSVSQGLPLRENVISKEQLYLERSYSAEIGSFSKSIVRVLRQESM